MTNSDIVVAFVDAWNRMDWDAVINLLTDDVIYHNIPMEKIEGKAAVRAAITGMQPLAVDWRILSIAENGDKVLTERVDDFDMPGGRHLSMPVMGTFEISDGRISAWRDYFDLATFTRQMA
ncbi:MAG: limonene-1,2-epoxide hydrolase family protein [Pseudomonadales bacterium]